jgi:hypothetical protein
MIYGNFEDWFIGDICICVRFESKTSTTGRNTVPAKVCNCIY